MKHHFFAFFLMWTSAIGGLSAQQFSLVEISNIASCLDYAIVDKKKNKIELPKHITKALECATVVDLTDNILTFLDKETVRLYNLISQKETRLFSLYPDIDGISNPAWSDDRSKIMFVIINQERKYGYTNMARIISLHLYENQEVKSKIKYDRPVHFICGSLCSSQPYHDFYYTESGIQYKRNENIEVRPGELDLIKN